MKLRQIIEFLPRFKMPPFHFTNENFFPFKEQNRKYLHNVKSSSGNDREHLFNTKRNSPTPPPPQKNKKIKSN